MQVQYNTIVSLFSTASLLLVASNNISAQQTVPPTSQATCLMTATELAAAVRNGRFSCEEVVASSFARIKQVNEYINAVPILLEDQARERAKQLGQLLTQGRDIGPLGCVPFTLKDAFDVEGVVSTYGIQGRSDFRPKQTATVVERLLSSGAILVGRSNIPELALQAGASSNPVFGETLNPFGFDYTPGGSSGGAAAIVAACGVPFEIGSDGGGSIRLPSAYCGVLGLKPTWGRVSTHGASSGSKPLHEGYSGYLNHVGPIARSMDDIRLLISIISGADGRDPTTVDRNPAEMLQHVDINTLSVAFHLSTGYTSAGADMERLSNEVLARITPAVKEVTEILPEYFSDDWLPRFQRIIILLDGLEGMLSTIESTGTSLSEVTQNTRNLLNWLRSQPVLTQSEKDAELDYLLDYRDRADRFFEQGYDIIISPVYTSGAPELPGISYDDRNSYLVVHNLTGLPAMSVPVGVSNEGLPLAVQVVGKRYHEHEALALSEYIYSTFGGYHPPGEFTIKKGPGENEATLTRWGTGRFGKAAALDGRIRGGPRENPAVIEIKEPQEFYFFQ